MRSILRLTALLGLLIGMNGCGDAAPTAVAPDQPAHLLDDLLDPDPIRPVLVSVLTRSTALTNDISVTAPIGKEGGTISIPQAGMSITFAPNALIPPSRQKTVNVTVKAIRGDEVAYEFAPHGITFRAPVIIRQSLVGMNTSLLPSLGSLEGAYFTSLSDLNLLNSVASVLEFQPTAVNSAGTSVSFNITHFSGYLVATGRR